MTDEQATPADLIAGARPASAPTHLFLVRHGQTVWHAENRYAGHASDIDLTDVGKLQARQLARWSATRRFDAVVSSPVRRAVETARHSADALHLPLIIEDDLREVDFGIAEGRTVAELRQLDSELVARFFEDPVANCFPGAEPPDQAGRRAAAALRSISTALPGGHVLVVGHNTLLRLGMCVLLQLPVSGYRTHFPRLDNAAVTELSVPADAEEAASLLCLNVPSGPS